MKYKTYVKGRGPILIISNSERRVKTLNKKIKQKKSLAFPYELGT